MVFLSSGARRTPMSTGSRTKHQKSLFLVAQVSNLSSLPSLNILATFFLYTIIYPKPRNTPTLPIKEEY
jgi:hypothetical protein